MNVTASSDALSAVGRWVFPRRLFVGLGFFVAGLFFIRPRQMFGDHELAGTLLSLTLVLGGLALRLWGGGSAGSHTRSGEIQAPRLATGGPYAYVRNPIYLGSIILGLGMVGLLDDPRLLLLHVAAFAFLYTVIVPAEEKFLRGEFGEEFENYRRDVPRMIPRLGPWSGRTERPFNWDALRGEARIAGILLFIYAAMRAAGHLQS